MKQLLTEVSEFFARRTKILLPAMFMALLAPSLMFTSELVKPNLSVIVNGEYVGMVENQQQFEEQVLQVERYAAEILDQPYKLNVETEYELSYGGNYETMSNIQLNDILSDYITGISVVARIYVDGQLVGAVDSQEQAYQLFDEILIDAVGVDLEGGASFVQDVEVIEALASTNEILKDDQIKDYFTSTAIGPSIHTVQQNQTLSEIANAYGMKTQEIVNLNPEVEPTRMKIGQNILIEKAQPAVSIAVTKKETYEESISYNTTTEYDDNMTTTQKTTLVEGQVGSKEIVAEVTYIDDVIVEKIILSEEVLKEPVDEVVKIGTKKPVVNGNFIMPVSGATLSSKYGYRSSGFHSGIDLALSYGKPIVASDGGTVTFSGWNGAYGYCVIVNHGNGVETLYAHASKLNVSVGAKVSQGDKIAEVGSTGRSTGNHLHFEIRINGKAVDPLNYL